MQEFVGLPLVESASGFSILKLMVCCRIPMRQVNTRSKLPEFSMLYHLLQRRSASLICSDPSSITVISLMAPRGWATSFGMNSSKKCA